MKTFRALENERMRGWGNGKKNKIDNILSIPLSLALAILFITAPGCAYYSFTGATIPANLNTIAIPLAEDVSAAPITALDETLTELLIERFVRQTRLSLEPSETEADALLEVRIDRYVNEPTAVSGDERAARNRVTLRVTARYYDRAEDKELVQRTFTSFEQYDPIATGLEGEAQAARAALENIADDIFTAATSNW